MAAAKPAAPEVVITAARVAAGASEVAQFKTVDAARDTIRVDAAATARDQPVDDAEALVATRADAAARAAVQPVIELEARVTVRVD